MQPVSKHSIHLFCYHNCTCFRGRNDVKTSRTPSRRVGFSSLHLLGVAPPTASGSVFRVGGGRRAERQRMLIWQLLLGQKEKNV